MHSYVLRLLENRMVLSSFSFLFFFFFLKSLQGKKEIGGGGFVKLKKVKKNV